MKRVVPIFLFLTTVIIILFCIENSYAKSDGAPSGNTGSPGDGQTCAHVSCHSGSASEKAGIIDTDVPVSGYLAGNIYLVTVTISESGINKFGFQASPQNIAGDLLGTISVINAVETKLVGGGKYITHTLSGNSGVDSRTWTFNWTPVDATGPVTFYVAVNASNNDDHATGDHIYTSSVTVQEDPTNIPLSVIAVNAIQFDILNPINNIITLNIATTVNAPLELLLSDANGRIIYAETTDYSNGVFEIPANNLSQGMYFITVSNATGQITKKIIKI